MKNKSMVPSHKLSKFITYQHPIWVIMSTVRVSSGISGIDAMLKGGFFANRVILLRGGPGTGKTIFSIQYLAEGAKKGQKGLFVTLEEPLESIRKTAALLGFDLDGYEKQNLIKTIDGSQLVYKFSEETKKSFEGHKPVVSQVVNQIKLEAEDFGAQRLVIDPITSAIIHQRFPTDKRLEILELIRTLRKIKCTSIITSESASFSGDEFFVEEYLADGVIILAKTMRNFVVTKSAWIEKMRGVNHDDQPRKYEITDKGIVVYATEPITV
ncbi:MAG: ATPase domain-containing protein [Candidatus Bathyarchaeia archaeon]